MEGCWTDTLRAAAFLGSPVCGAVVDRLQVVVRKGFAFFSVALMHLMTSLLDLFVTPKMSGVSMVSIYHFSRNYAPTHVIAGVHSSELSTSHLSILSQQKAVFPFFFSSFQ